MIDNEYTPWLIEINSSPSMDYSTVNLINIYKFLRQLPND